MGTGRANGEELFYSSLLKLMKKNLWSLMFPFFMMPFTLWSASPWEMDPKKYRPALPPWLLPRNKIQLSNELNAFYPEIYLNWKERLVRSDQQKILKMISQESQTGMRQHTRLKYDHQSKIAKNCSIAKCSQ